jgi:uncharacterized GH25 family protein
MTPISINVGEFVTVGINFLDDDKKPAPVHDVLVFVSDPSVSSGGVVALTMAYTPNPEPTENESVILTAVAPGLNSLVVNAHAVDGSPITNQIDFLVEVPVPVATTIEFVVGTPTL